MFRARNRLGCDPVGHPPWESMGGEDRSWGREMQLPRLSCTRRGGRGGAIAGLFHEPSWHLACWIPLGRRRQSGCEEEEEEIIGGARNWANSGRQWRTGKPMLQSVGLQRVRHDSATEQQERRRLARGSQGTGEGIRRGARVPSHQKKERRA